MRPLFAFLCIALLSPGTGMAQAPDRDERRWVVDLQFGTYKPRIDSQFQRGENSATPPYEEAFGTGRIFSLPLGLNGLLCPVLGQHQLASSRLLEC